MILWIVNLTVLVLIGLTVWWFLLIKPKALKVDGNTVDILVQNGIYEPAIIQAKQGQTLHLRFLRKDKSPCAEVVIFEKLNLSAKLPVNQALTLTLELKDKGEFEFTCQMGMYRGKLIVE